MEEVLFNLDSYNWKIEISIEKVDDRKVKGKYRRVRHKTLGL